jgi:predicted lipoprotein with Yx(FWY)xxD motif
VFVASGLAAASLLAAACGGGTGYGGGSNAAPTSANAAPSAAAATPLAVGTSSLGRILVDGQGRTLYLFAADTAGTSRCTSAGCVAEWPPFTSNDAPQVGAGLAANQLGTTTRPDGQKQITYSGHPLYHFAGDSQPGTTAGQGLNDNGGVWHVVHADGTPVDNS